MHFKQLGSKWPPPLWHLHVELSQGTMCYRFDLFLTLSFILGGDFEDDSDSFPLHFPHAAPETVAHATIQLV